MSQSQKSSKIWNVIGPDDPYDITKSMIAKLPNHSNTFMGKNIELVCLMQSAQIQRLTQYLSEYKVKYQEMVKVKLDRHSYEIQIKELTEKVNQYFGFMAENQKLKGFVKRQGIELEELQKRRVQSASFEALESKYSSLLYELKISRQHVENAEQNVNKYRIQSEEWQMKFMKAEQNKNMQLVQERQRLEIHYRQKFSFEIKQYTYKHQIQLQRVRAQLSSFKEQQQIKNHEISSLKQQKQHLMRQMRRMEDENRQKNNIQNVILEKQSQITSLNNMIKQKTNAYQIVVNDFRSLEQRWKISQREKQRLIVINREMESYKSKSESIGAYEEKTALMSMEIERLKSLLVTKDREIEGLRVDLQKILILKEKYQRNIQQTTSKISKLEQSQRLLSVNQNKASLLSQQLQRSNYTLKAKEEQLSSLRIKIQTFSSQITGTSKQKSKLDDEYRICREQLRNLRTITDREINSLREENSRLKLQINQQNSRYRELNQRMDKVMREMGESSQKANHNSKIQQDNMKKIIEQQKETAIRQQMEIKKLRNIVDQRNIQLTRLKSEFIVIKQLEGNNQHLMKENKLASQENYHLKAELNSIKIKEQKSEETMSKIFEEIGRLQSLLTEKNSQIQKCKRELNIGEEKYKYLLDSKRELEIQNKSSLEIEIRTKVETYELKIQQINRNIHEFQQKCSRLSQQKSQLQQNLAQKQHKIEDLSRQKQTISRNLEQLRRQFSLKTSSDQNSSQQILKLKQQIHIKTLKIQQCERRIVQTEERHSIQKQTNKRQFENLRNKCTSITIQLQQLAQNRQDFANENMLLKKNIEDLSRVSKIQQTDEIQRLNREISSLKITVTEYQSKIVHIENTSNMMFEERYNIINKEKVSLEQLLVQKQQRIVDLKKENTSIAINLEETRRNFEDVRRNFDDSRISSNNQTQEVHRLNRQISSLKVTINEYQVKLTQTENTTNMIFEQKYNKITREKINLEQILANKEQQIADLSRTFDDSRRSSLHQTEEVQRLNRQIFSLKTTVTEYKTKITQKENATNVMYEQKFNQIYQEKIHLQQLISQKDQKIAELIRNLEDALRNLDNFSKKTNTHQTQQVQRLNRQISTLKVTINEFQTKIVHLEKSNQKVIQSKLSGKDQIIYDLQNKLRELQRKIKEMTDNERKGVGNLQNYEDKISLLSMQLERLHGLKDHQMEKQRNQWKHRLSQQTSLFNTKQRQAEDLKIRIQKLVRQISAANNEVSSQNILISKKMEEANQRRLFESNQQIERYKIQIQNLKTALNQLEQINQHTIQERDELFRISHEQQSQLNTIKSSFHQEVSQTKRQLTIKIEQIRKYEHQISLLRKGEESYLTKLRDYEHKLIKAEENIEISMRKQYQQQDKIIFEQKTKINQLYHIIEQLNHQQTSLKIQNTNLKTENDQLNEIAHEIQFKLNQYSSNIDSDISSYKIQTEKLRHNLNGQTNENSELKSNIELNQMKISSQFQQIKKLNQTIKHYSVSQSKMNEYSSQIRLINDRMVAKNEQVHDWQSKYVTLYNAYEVLYGNYQMTKSQYDALIITTQNYEYKISKIETQFEALTQILDRFKAQNDQMRGENYELKMKFKGEGDLYEKNSRLSAQIDRLNEMLTKSKKEVSDLRLRMTDNLSLQKRLQEYLSLMVLLFAEIETLRARVSETQQECQEVRRSSISPYRVDRRR